MAGLCTALLGHELDPVHHLGLRLATGAYGTSPVLSLYAEANEMSLDRRRFSLGFMYALKDTVSRSASSPRGCQGHEIPENF